MREPEFVGPFAIGPPPEALRVQAPPLTAIRWAEVVRFMRATFIFTITLTKAAVLKLVRGRGRSWGAAMSEGLVDAFELLGPTYVKLGQLIASSPGVFPEPLADACLRTLDDVPPFPGAVARRIIEEDLGAPVERAFASFDDVPLSAASIAQVHACTMPDGSKAVLKIQRPNITDIMNRDLRIMYRMAKLVDRTKKGHLMNVPGVIEDLHQVSNEELNFAFEAHRQTRFRDNIGAFGDNKHITAPEVFWSHCGPRMICMERMYGVPLDEFENLRDRGIDGELVLRRGVKVWMEAALVHGPFHGDVHAGNLWLLDDGRASYLDFGIMGELPPDHQEAVKATQYTAMIDGDYIRIVRAWQKIGILGNDVGPEEEVAARLKMVMEPMLDLKLGEVSIGSMMKQQLDLQQEYGARAARELVLVTKQLMYFERYAKQLAPDYNMSRDVFLVKNIFPDEVAKIVEERGITLPD